MSGQLTLVRSEGFDDASFREDVLVAKLDVNTPGYVGLVDKYGVLHYALLQHETCTKLAQFQLQFGTQLRFSQDGVEDLPRAVQRPWRLFDFVPARPDAILLSQAGSSKILFTTLPSPGQPGSPVFLFGAHSDEITCFALQQAGTWMVSGCVGGTIKLWHIIDGSQRDVHERVHLPSVESLAFLDPAVVVSGGSEGGVKIWEVAQGQLLARQSIATPLSPIVSLAAFMPPEPLQGELLDATRALPWQAPPHALRARPAGSSLGGASVLIAAGTADGLLFVWAATGVGEATWQLRHLGQQARGAPIRALSFAPAGGLLAMAAGTRQAGHVWLFSTATFAYRLCEAPLLGPPIAAAFCPWQEQAGPDPLLMVSPVPGGAGVVATPLDRFGPAPQASTPGLWEHSPEAEAQQGGQEERHVSPLSASGWDDTEAAPEARRARPIPPLPARYGAQSPHPATAPPAAPLQRQGADPPPFSSPPHQPFPEEAEPTSRGFEGMAEDPSSSSLPPTPRPAIPTTRYVASPAGPPHPASFRTPLRQAGPSLESAPAVHGAAHEAAHPERAAPIPSSAPIWPPQTLEPQQPSGAASMEAPQPKGGSDRWQLASTPAFQQGSQEANWQSRAAGNASEHSAAGAADVRAGWGIPAETGLEQLPAEPGQGAGRAGESTGNWRDYGDDDAGDAQRPMQGSPGRSYREAEPAAFAELDPSPGGPDSGISASLQHVNLRGPESPSGAEVPQPTPASKLPTPMRQRLQQRRPAAPAAAPFKHSASSLQPDLEPWPVPGQDQPPALAEPQLNSTRLLLRKIQQLSSAEMDAKAVLAEPTNQSKIKSCAAGALNIPRDAKVFSNLPPVTPPALPAAMPKAVPKQLHPGWVASRAMKPQLSDLWNPKDASVAFLSTRPVRRHYAYSAASVAEAVLGIH